MCFIRLDWRDDSLRILGSQAGKARVDTEDGKLPPQIYQLRSVVGDRQIDILVISIGGNDAGFVPALRDLVEHDSHPFADDVADIAKRVEARLAELRKHFDALAPILTSMHVRPSHVLLMTYPDPFYGRASDLLTHDILEDAADSDLEWAGVSWNLFSASLSPGEMSAAREIFIHPLNALLREVAAKYGWTIVELQDALRGHGYSEELDEMHQRWTMVTTFKDSLQKQGCADGTMHPNAAGQNVIAAIIKARYQYLLGDIHPDGAVASSQPRK